PGPLRRAPPGLRRDAEQPDPVLDRRRRPPAWRSPAPAGLRRQGPGLRERRPGRRPARQGRAGLPERRERAGQDPAEAVGLLSRQPSATTTGCELKAES